MKGGMTMGFYGFFSNLLVQVCEVNACANFRGRGAAQQPSKPWFQPENPQNWKPKVTHLWCQNAAKLGSQNEKLEDEKLQMVGRWQVFLFGVPKCNFFTGELREEGGTGPYFRPFLGVGKLPKNISRNTYSLNIGEYLHFRYLKCWVILSLEHRW